MDTGNFDFSYPITSPCVDVGNPNIIDPDSSRSDIGSEYFDHQIPITLEIPTQGNWNIVGLPVVVDNPVVEEVFPQSIENTLFMIDNDGNYLAEDSLIVGRGYWLRFSEDGVENITGNPITTNVVILQSGWNLISGISADVAVSSIVDEDSLIVQNTIFYYDDRHYLLADTLKPGKGYWLRSIGGGTIEIRLNP